MCIQPNESAVSIPSSKNRENRNQNRKKRASKRDVTKPRSPVTNNIPTGRGERKPNSPKTNPTPIPVPQQIPEIPQKLRKNLKNISVPIPPIPEPAPEVKPPVVRNKLSRHVAQVLNQTNDLKFRKKPKTPEVPLAPPPPPPPPPEKSNIATKLTKKIWDFMNRDLGPPPEAPVNPLEPGKEPVPNNNKTKNVAPQNPNANPNLPKLQTTGIQDGKPKKKRDAGNINIQPESSNQQNKLNKKGGLDRNIVVQQNEVTAKLKGKFRKGKEKEIVPEVIEEEEKKNPIKLQMRKQIWAISKPFIKRNERLSKLMKANNIDLDSIRIDKLDLSLIDIDQLGIENKALKKSIIWLLK